MASVWRRKSISSDVTAVKQRKSGSIVKRIQRKFSRSTGGNTKKRLSLDQSSFVSETSTSATDSPLSSRDAVFDGSAFDKATSSTSVDCEDLDRVAAVLQNAYESHRKFVAEARSTLEEQHRALNRYMALGMTMFLLTALSRAFQDMGIPLLNIPPPSEGIFSKPIASAVGTIVITMMSLLLMYRADLDCSKVCQKLNSHVTANPILQGKPLAQETEHHSLSRPSGKPKEQNELTNAPNTSMIVKPDKSTGTSNLILSPDGSICATRQELDEIASIRERIEPVVRELESHYHSEHPDQLGPNEKIEEKFPYIISDQAVLRFLHGHKTVKAASEKLVKMLKWRIDDNMAKYAPLVEKILETYRKNKSHPKMDALPHWQEIADNLPCDSFAGSCPVGDNFCWEKTGKISPKGLVEQVGAEKVWEFHFVHMEVKAIIFHDETVRRATQMANGEASFKDTETIMCKSILLKDLSGLGRHHLNRDGLMLLNGILKTSQAYYPEVLRVCYLVRAPSVFRFVWRLITPALDKVTLEKVKIPGNNDKWKRELSAILGGSDTLFVDHIE